jgi:hypothetical protein
VHQRAEELGATIRWQPPADLPALRFDPEGIARAVLNVVTNALDAVESRPDPTISIEARVEREEGRSSDACTTVAQIRERFADSRFARCARLLCPDAPIGDRPCSNYIEAGLALPAARDPFARDPLRLSIDPEPATIEDERPASN